MSQIIFCTDNISTELRDFIQSQLGAHDLILPINGGRHSATFQCILNMFYAHPYLPTDRILIQEDDYIYLPGAEHQLEDALKYGHYVTGYLHPDKFMEYGKGGNPSTYSENISEETRVVKTPDHFWMMTNSTTGTFATTAKTLYEDISIWHQFSEGRGATDDYHAFIELRKMGRAVLMPIPTLSTHAMPAWAAPLIGTKYSNWDEVLTL